MFQSVVCADRTSKSPKIGFDIVGIPIRVEASRGFKVRIVYKIGKRPSESSVKTNKQLWKRALHFVSLHQKCHDKRYCGYTIRMPFFDKTPSRLYLSCVYRIIFYFPKRIEIWKHGLQRQSFHPDGN